MATITLTKEQTADVLKQALKALETGNHAPDFKTTIVRISKGERFNSSDIGEQCDMSAKSVGMRLIAMAKQGYVKKVGGGNWKRT